MVAPGATHPAFPIWVWKGIGGDFNTVGSTLAVVPDEHHRVNISVEVVSVEESSTVFFGARGKLVELPIVEVTDLGH